MKIGVIAHFPDEEAGGGSTFESAMISAIEGGDHKHQYTILYPGVESRVPESGVSAIVVREQRGMMGFARRVLRWLAANVMPPIFYRWIVALRHQFWGLPKHKVGSESIIHLGHTRLDSVLREQSLEALWHLFPGWLDVALPQFVTVWDLQHRMSPWFPEVSHYGWNWEAREEFYEKSLPRAAGILVGTEQGKSEVERFYGVNPDNIHVNPLPVPELAKRATAANGEVVLAKYGLRPGYLYYPAQFWPHKNHINLLLALIELQRMNGLKLELVLTGSDKGNQKLVEHEAAKLGLNDRVHFLGFVDTNDIPALYANALCLTFVSFFGPDNIPPLEAIEMGCPVIAADVPGAREQLGNGAIFVNPGKPLEIAEAIAAISAEPDLGENLVQQGRQQLKGRDASDYLANMEVVFDKFQNIRKTWKVG